MRALIARDLEDAAIQELSDDRRFATAHNAALQTFEAARLALGASAARHLDFFEACRRKRNVIDYDHASVATHTEAEEIVAETNDFFELVEHWIATNHPKLNP